MWIWLGELLDGASMRNGLLFLVAFLIAHTGLIHAEPSKDDGLFGMVAALGGTPVDLGEEVKKDSNDLPQEGLAVERETGTDPTGEMEERLPEYLRKPAAFVIGVLWFTAGKLWCDHHCPEW